MKDSKGDYLAVEVMNIRFAGPGVPLAPGALPGDGSFEVVLVREDDRAELLEYLSRRLDHDDIDMPALTIVSGRAVILQAPDGRLRVDDELHEGIEQPVRCTSWPEPSRSSPPVSAARELGVRM